MIALWPEAITAGMISGSLCHILDIMPTLLDITCVSYLDKFRGNAILPMEGESLYTVFQGDTEWNRSPILYKFSGNSFLKEGDWKLVAQVGDSWELYNLRADRTETNNLVKKYPEKVRRVSEMYEDWAKRVGALSSEQAMKMPLNTRAHYTFQK